MSAPRISVIIPYYRAGTFIADAIASIRRQNYPNLEIILIDDGSEDGIAERVREFGDIVFLQQSNQGPAAARNAGIRKATGDIIAFLDADDIWPDDKLALQLPKLEEDPALGIVTGRVQYIRLQGAEDRSLPFDENNTIIHVHLGAALVRRTVFDDVGLFDENFRVSEDMDWFLRVREKSVKTAIIPETTLFYQMHASNMTRQLTVQKARMAEVLKASLNRRRAAQGQAQDLGSFSEYGGAPKLDVARYTRQARTERHKRQPLITAIIAVHNGEAYLAEAIESVLQQTWPSLELIIVDDGSTDSSAQIVQSYGDRIRYHYQENAGLGAARNAGIAMARGNYIAFLDADDLWPPQKLERQMEFLKRNPDAGMVFGLAEQFHSPELPEERKRELQDHGQILAGYSGGTLLARKEIFEKVGLFSTHIQIGEFIDWYARATDAGVKTTLLEEIMLRRRLHNSNMGVRMKDRRHEYLKVLKDSLDRRRRVQ